MGPTAGLDGRKISSPPVFDPGPSSPVAQSLYRLSYRAQRCIFYTSLSVTARTIAECLRTDCYILGDKIKNVFLS